MKELAKQGLVEGRLGSETMVVLWESATKTAAAYRPVAIPAVKAKGAARKLTLFRDDKIDSRPVTDRETGSRWDITGRAYEGELKGWTLEWLDGVQVKWFAWAAEYPATTIHGK